LLFENDPLEALAGKILTEVYQKGVWKDEGKIFELRRHRQGWKMQE